MLFEVSAMQRRSRDVADWLLLSVPHDPRTCFCSFTFNLKYHIMIAMITNIYFVQP